MTPTVARLEDLDRAALVRFLSHFADDTRTEAEWRARLQRFWEQNPTPGPWGWGLSLDDAVVGMLGLIPLRFRVEGRDVDGVASTTWRVDPAHRGSSTELLFRFRGLGRKMPLITTTPAPHVQEMLARLRFEPLVPGALRQVSVVPLNAFAAHRLGRPLAPMLSKALGIAGRRLGGGWRRADPAQVDFDALWIRTRDAAAFARVRDTDRCRWYVGDRALLIDGPPDAPDAYAVFSPGTWRGQPVMRLFDYWPPPQHPDRLRRLVRFLWSDPFDGRASLALLHHPTAAFGAALVGAPALHRPARGSTMMLNGRRLPTHGRYFTLGEGDSGF